MGANEVAAVFEELFESVCFQRFVVVEVVTTDVGFLVRWFIQTRERKVVHTADSRIFERSLF